MWNRLESLFISRQTFQSVLQYGTGFELCGTGYNTELILNYVGRAFQPVHFPTDWKVCPTKRKFLEYLDISPRSILQLKSMSADRNDVTWRFWIRLNSLPQSLHHRVQPIVGHAKAF